MKKLLLTMVTLSVLIVPRLVSAQDEDTQIIDAANKKDQEAIVALQENLQFKQFNSCDAMEKVMKGLVDKLGQDSYYRPYYKGMGAVPEAAMDMATSNAGNAKEESTSSSNDYSTTNLQKIGVDEPEILKSDGKYVYYYNSRDNKIYIINSPLDIAKSTINLSNAYIKKVVSIPTNFQNTQIFVSKNRLVILATRYLNTSYGQSLLDRNTKTSLAIYDTTNINQLKLLKFVDQDGYYTDARMIGNKLYMISNLNINRYYPRYLQEEKKDTTAIYKNFKENFLPTVTDIVNNKKNLLYPSCESISYILPSDETMEKVNLNPQFTVIGIVNIEDTSAPTKVNVLLSQAGQIHMTQKSLYITQNIWFNSPRRCPAGMYCIMPSFGNGEFSLIHKFGVNGFDLKYNNTNVVPGNLLNQYSMDEDSKGNFRILTQKRDTQNNTNLYIFDNNLKLAGKLENIEPGETFKASRYIESKLYLVTFEQIDPLFVVDVADIKNPKIVGSLKTPGYSTYLHPMGNAKAGIQYLIGLGNDVVDNGYGGQANGGIQVSLYEVNYNKKETAESKCGQLMIGSSNKARVMADKCIATVDSGNIMIREINKVVLGGKGSRSESTTNPRMFVLDKKNNLTLPLVLAQETKEGENCNISKDAKGKEIRTNCYPVIKQKTTFAGLKTFSLNTKSGIKEVFSVDYKHLFEKTREYNYGDEINSREVMGKNMRVGFLGDAVYMINNDFFHFVNPVKNNVGKYIYTNPLLKAPTTSGLGLEKACTANGGTWLKDFKECEGIGATTCTNNGGKFFECESACRNTKSEVCTLQCIQVCRPSK